MGKPPHPAPSGFKWVFCTYYRHAKSGKIMIAAT